MAILEIYTFSDFIQICSRTQFILNKMGIKTADAIRMFLTQVCLTKSLPLNVKLPNRVTKNAIKAGEIGKVTKITSEEFDDLLGI